MADLRPRHQQQVQRLSTELAGNDRPIRVKKRTVSNLFRYDGRGKDDRRKVDLRDFNQPLHIDIKAQTLEVQGLTTFEQIVDFTLPHGFVPLVTPELKRITIGGAIVGIGIETNSYKFGFVHDGLLEADVLLPDGRIVTCSETNEHKDLFAGLANSYGTLGYVLRAKIKLRPAKKYVKLVTNQHATTASLVSTMKRATAHPKVDYMESLIYGKDQLYLTIGTQTNSARKVSSIYGQSVFYRQISKPGTIWLPTKEYLFRYDPEWFWAIPETKTYTIFRAIAPRSMRSSAFYTRYLAWQEKSGVAKQQEDLEKLIQDWEVPWKHAKKLLDFALDNLDLDGKPLMTAPTKTAHQNTLYPMPLGELYLNLGSYNFVKRRPEHPPYHHTRIMDEFTFAHDGIKMLYSSTFMDEKEFDARYGGKAYRTLKKKYDPKSLAPTLYQKAVQSR
jgi:FAD/FMN-containing dehydrogenase